MTGTQKALENARMTGELIKNKVGGDSNAYDALNLTDKHARATKRSKRTITRLHVLCILVQQPSTPKTQAYIY